MKPPFFEPIIAAIAPKLALERANNRSKLQRSYDGAAKGRRTGDWRANGTSANMEVQQALPWLRSRSRDLARNNPYQANIVQRLLPNNIVGAGIIPTPLFASANGSADTAGAKRTNDRIKNQWKLWADKTTADYDGQLNFYGLQHMTIKAWAESGECFVVRKINADLAFPLQLQILEGDYLDTSKHDQKPPSDGSLRNWYGIQFDARNQRSGYWLFKNHPVEYSNSESIFVPARDVIHLYEVHRPGQMRGVPGSSAAMIKLRDLDKFEDAELSRQLVAACYAAFVTKIDGQDDVNPANKDAAGLAIDHMEPGMIEYLQPGESVTFANPSLSTGYDAYTRNVQRSIATGNGVTYEGMTGDLSNVNFSSGRMGWLEFQRNVYHWQWNVIIPRFERVWEWFIEAAAILGVVPIGNQVPVSWTPPRREMIDPVKETTAMENMVRAGFKGWQATVRELGDNPEEVLQQLKEDHEAFVKAGLKPTSDPAFDTERIAAEAIAKQKEAAKEEETTKPKK